MYCLAEGRVMAAGYRESVQTTSFGERSVLGIPPLGHATRSSSQDLNTRAPTINQSIEFYSVVEFHDIEVTYQSVKVYLNSL